MVESNFQQIYASKGLSTAEGGRGHVTTYMYCVTIKIQTLRPEVHSLETNFRYYLKFVSKPYSSASSETTLDFYTYLATSTFCDHCNLHCYYIVSVFKLLVYFSQILMNVPSILTVVLRIALTPLDPIAAVAGLGTDQFTMDTPVKVHVSPCTVALYSWA